MNTKRTLSVILAVSLLVLPAVALASSTSGFTSVSPFEGTSSGNLLTAIRNIVNALLALAAIIAAIFVVIGGVRYITAQGDEDAVALAKSTVIYALLGVVIIALSAVLVNFIINAIP